MFGKLAKDLAKKHGYPMKKKRETPKQKKLREAREQWEAFEQEGEVKFDIQPQSEMSEMYCEMRVKGFKAKESYYMIVSAMRVFGKKETK